MQHKERMFMGAESTDFFYYLESLIYGAGGDCSNSCSIMSSSRESSLHLISENTTEKSFTT